MFDVFWSNARDGNMATMYDGVNGSDALANRARFMKRRNIGDTSFTLMVPKENRDKVELVTPGLDIARSDAIVSAEAGHTLAVLPADCPSLAVFDARTEMVAIAHCGRTSVEADLHVRVVEVFKALGSRSPDIKVVISPGIKAASYVFSSELSSLFQDRSWGPYKTYSSGLNGVASFNVDLNRRIEEQLLSCGIKAKNIRASKVDTYTNLKYFSHKRSAENPGRFPEARIMFGALRRVRE